jgi:hypothetical protein
MTPLLITQMASPPAPSDIAGYLLQSGWSHEKNAGHWAVYSKSIEKTDMEIAVPLLNSASDYPRAVRHLLGDLARVEERTEASILRDIHGASLDILRLAIEGGETRDGRISVEAGRRVFDAVRDLVLAAACSVIEPRPVYTKRKPDKAMQLLNRARFGQTEFGSFVVTVESTVPPRLGQNEFCDVSATDPDAPLERKTSLRLVEALDATVGACQEAGSTNELEPFRRFAHRGVSANLCESIAEIIDASSAETIRTSMSFAARRPVLSNVPRHAAFSSDVSPLLKEAARRLREDATYPAIDLTGTVVKLESPDALSGGEVVLRTSFDRRLRLVRFRLETDDYRKAVKAHGERSFITCRGDLMKDGRDWVLQSPREFSLIDEVAWPTEESDIPF